MMDIDTGSERDTKNTLKLYAIEANRDMVQRTATALTVLKEQ